MYEDVDIIGLATITTKKNTTTRWTTTHYSPAIIHDAAWLMLCAADMT